MLLSSTNVLNPEIFFYNSSSSNESSHRSRKLKVYAQKQTVEEAGTYSFEDLGDAKSLKKSKRSNNAGASSVSSGVRLEHISKTFKGVQVLKDVSWEVKKGERVGLVGVNGAGMYVSQICLRIF